MKHPDIVLAACLFSLTLSTNALGQAGTLDPSFDFDGIVTSNVLSSYAEGVDVVVQPDGKIIVAGTVVNLDPDLFVSRYNSDGSPDSTFSDDGVVIFDLGPTEQAGAVTLQSDGKILMCGATFTSSMDIVLLRFNGDGSPDATFGSGDGMVITALGGADEYGLDVNLQPDGKIIVAGSTWLGTYFVMYVARYNADGSLDLGFNGSGWAVADPGAAAEGAASAIQQDGKILLAGKMGPTTTSDMLVARFDSSGILDPTFDGDGMHVVAVDPMEDAVRDMVVQPDGRILLSGWAFTGDYYDFAVVRLNPDGSLDNTFGGDGIVTTGLGVGDDIGQKLVLQSDGKILQTGGTLGPNNNFDIGVVRYLVDGSMDPAFGSGGTVDTEVSNDYDFGQGIAMAGDGAILITGSASIGSGEMVLLRYLNDLNVGLLDLNSAGCSALVYPNPLADEAVLQYELKAQESLRLEMFDAQGRSVRTYFTDSPRQAGLHKETLDLSCMSAGNYTIVITDGTGKVSVRVVKQ